MDNRQKLVLKKKLQDLNIVNGVPPTGVKPKPDPLRKIQEDSERRQRQAKQAGMVGELGRLFLKQQRAKADANDAHADDNDDDDEDLAQGLWEGWHEDDEDFEQRQPQAVDDDWEEEEAVVPKAKKQKNEKAKKKKEASNKDLNHSPRPSDVSRGDPSFRAVEDSPNAQLDLSSIKSDNSEYSPTRRNVEGNAVKVPPIAHPNKQDDTVNFGGSKEAGFGRQPTFNGGQQNPNLLGVQGGSRKNLSQGPGSRRSSRDELQEGSQRSIKQADSNADQRSQRNSTGSGTKSVSVLQVKKRDKSNLMNNLARIHAQRVEDENQVVREEDEDEADHEPKDVDWQKRLEKLMHADPNKRVKIPGERMEERVKKRKNRDQGLDKWGVKSVPRKKNHEANKVSYRFKNKLEEEEKKKTMGVNIELLHTDELMAYYRELICKGKRDFTEHQKFQNQIKKLEYENTICNPKSVEKSRSKSPDGQNKLLQRYVKENSVQIQVKPPESTSRSPSTNKNANAKKTKAKPKSKEKVVMRKTQAF